MKTLLQFPPPRDPQEKERAEVIYFSVFDDVVPLWSVADWGGELEQGGEG